jgi:hypothetical protein
MRSYKPSASVKVGPVSSMKVRRLIRYFKSDLHVRIPESIVQPEHHMLLVEKPAADAHCPGLHAKRFESK